MIDTQSERLRRIAFEAELHDARREIDILNATKYNLDSSAWTAATAAKLTATVEATAAARASENVGVLERCSMELRAEMVMVAEASEHGWKAQLDAEKEAANRAVAAEKTVANSLQDTEQE